MRALKIIASVLCCILIFATLVAAIIFYNLNVITQVHTIAVDEIMNIGAKEIIKDLNEDAYNELIHIAQYNGVSEEQLIEVLENNAVVEYLGDYAKDALTDIINGNELKVIDKVRIKELLGTGIDAIDIDQIEDIVNKNTNASISISDDYRDKNKIKEFINDTIDNEIDDKKINEEINDLINKNVDTQLLDTARTVKNVLDSTFLRILPIIIIAVLGAIIIWLNIKSFNWQLYLGIAFFASGLISVIIFAVTNSAVNKLNIDVKIINNVVKKVTTDIGEGLFTAAYISIAAGLVFIIAFSIVKIIKHANKNRGKNIAPTESFNY